MGGLDAYPLQVARTYGEEYPERPLMSVISDLLGIAHFTTSRGSTVRRDFLDAVARRLGVPDELLSASTKDEVLARAVRAATGRPVTDDLFSPGATVTNRALQTILDGLLINGVPGRLAAGFPSEPEAQAWSDEPFDPDGVKDDRDRALAEVAAREGADRFRQAVLEAYGGRCAISGFDAPQALEAAHIYPYRGPATNKVSNGLLLRADLHRLFDRGAVAIDESTLEVLLRPDLMATRYRVLIDERVRLRLPKVEQSRPSVAALRSHREWAGL